MHLGQISSVGVDLQWVALLFVILSGSIISAPLSLAQRWGFRRDEQHTLSESWYDATLECLHLSEHLTRHWLDTLQATVVLTTSAYMLGRMRSQSVLMATAIRMAQNLGFDRLGEEPEGLSEGIVPRESARRACGMLSSDRTTSSSPSPRAISCGPCSTGPILPGTAATRTWSRFRTRCRPS